MATEKGGFQRAVALKAVAAEREMTVGEIKAALEHAAREKRPKARRASAKHDQLKR